MKTIDLLRTAGRVPEGCAGRTWRGNAEDPQREMALSRYRALRSRGDDLGAAESARRDGLPEEMKAASGAEYGRLIGLAQRTGDVRLYAQAFRIASGFGLGAEAIAAASEGMRNAGVEEEGIIGSMASGSGKLDDNRD